MNREEAITTLKNYIERITGGMFPGEREILVEAFDTLHSPWVKTAERLPTEADAGIDEEVLTIYDDGETRVMGTDYWAYVAKVPERFPYWLPVPKLPEVEG